jgi:hypothetical protein
MADTSIEPRCSAHGRTAAEHVDKHVDDCTMPMPSASCPECVAYATTGMHWDTCPYRGSRRTPDPTVNVDDIHVELRRLDAFVRAYQEMTNDPERRRALNYLNDRFPGPKTMRG